MNLVSNSIEASSAGQNVVISAEKGVGMDKEVLENVFVPFYTKKNKGTGFGMAMVKKIVEGHSGEITIDSRVGHGTEVIVELPYRPLSKGKHPPAQPVDL